jgi:hypothetical protein
MPTELDANWMPKLPVLSRVHDPSCESAWGSLCQLRKRAASDYPLQGEIGQMAEERRV